LILKGFSGSIAPQLISSNISGPNLKDIAYNHHLSPENVFKRCTNVLVLGPISFVLDPAVVFLTDP
jgi:hypothetical protein